MPSRRMRSMTVVAVAAVAVAGMATLRAGRAESQVPREPLRCSTVSVPLAIGNVGRLYVANLGQQEVSVRLRLLDGQGTERASSVRLIAPGKTSSISDFLTGPPPPPPGVSWRGEVSVLSADIPLESLAVSLGVVDSNGSQRVGDFYGPRLVEHCQPLAGRRT